MVSRRVVSLLAVVTLGLAGAALAQDTVIKIDGTTYRLNGIDLPEPDQNCLNEVGELYSCGRKVAEELSKFVAGRPITCNDASRRSCLPQETHWPMFDRWHRPTPLAR